LEVAVQQRQARLHLVLHLQQQQRRCLVLLLLRQRLELLLLRGVFGAPAAAQQQVGAMVCFV
jgi:hypothetical protein